LQHGKVILDFMRLLPEMKPLKKELSSYKRARGSVQFPLSDPIPYDLIKKIALFRAKESTKKEKEWQATLLCVTLTIDYQTIVV